MRHVLALPAALLLGLIAASCITPVEDDAHLGDAVERGLSRGTSAGHPQPGFASIAGTWLPQHNDACGNTCYDLSFELCGRDGCGGDPDAQIECHGTTLSCRAAMLATTGTATGLSACWRECQGLQ